MSLLLLGGCASVPEESVKLSQNLASLIKISKSTHINLINKHFSVMATNIDRFAMNEYKQAFLDNVRRIMRRENPTFDELTLEQYDKAMMRVIKIRNEWIDQLKKAHTEMLLKTEQLYADMMEVNYSLTSLLVSVTGLESSQRNILDSIENGLSKKARDLEADLFQYTSNLEKMMIDSLSKIGN